MALTSFGREASVIPGQCVCGDLRYQAERSEWCAHCHCEWCRRAHGAAFVTYFGVAHPAFRLLDPEGRLQWFGPTPEASRGFCSRCGTTLFFRGDRWPDEIHVVLASVTEGMDRAPQVHVYWDHRAAWLPLGDDLPRLGGDSGMEPIAEAKRTTIDHEG